MPRIHFVNDGITHEVAPGTSLGQAALEAGASVPFGCRSGTCGACVLDVVEGAESIEEPGFAEDDTLREIGQHDQGRRLGCQIILRDEDLSVAW
jgi:ferredoxin